MTRLKLFNYGIVLAYLSLIYVGAFMHDLKINESTSTKQKSKLIKFNLLTKEIKINLRPENLDDGLSSSRWFLKNMSSFLKNKPLSKDNLLLIALLAWLPVSLMILVIQNDINFNEIKINLIDFTKYLIENRYI